VSIVRSQATDEPGAGLTAAHEKPADDYQKLMWTDQIGRAARYLD
jgi:hypothetical protein